jgi:hypothetical protein
MMSSDKLATTMIFDALDEASDVTAMLDDAMACLDEDNLEMALTVLESALDVCWDLRASINNAMGKLAESTND